MAGHINLVEKEYVDSLETEISASVTDLRGQVSSISSSLEEEVSSRVNADKALQSSISANETLIQKEIDDRKAGDSSLQESLSTKLDKVVSTSSSPRLYSVSPEGQQSTVTYSTSAGADSVAQRSSTGTLKVKDPVDDDDAASKQYVHNVVASKQNKPNVDTITENTLTVSDNSEYYGENITTLTITYPTGNFECWLRFQFAETGTITVTLPTSRYIGEAPQFKNGETWEISIKDGVVVAQKLVDDNE